MSDKYIKTYGIDDIPNYPFLFIREGGFVFVTDKHTGEISEKLTVGEYCDRWMFEYKNNPDWKAYFGKGYTTPKASPDTARDITELHKLCSDTTRHKKGDDAYLLDFMLNGGLAISESSVLVWLCANVQVWSYVYTNYDLIAKGMNKDIKYINTTVKKLERKGMLKILNKKFDNGLYLIKIHPKIIWKGRYSAFAVAAGESYEYTEDNILDSKVDT